jgi:hypothetical protein
MHSDSIFNPFFLLHDPENWGSVKLVVTSESVMQLNSQLGQFFSGTVLQLRKQCQAACHGLPYNVTRTVLYFIPLILLALIVPCSLPFRLPEIQY